MSLPTDPNTVEPRRGLEPRTLGYRPRVLPLNYPGTNLEHKQRIERWLNPYQGFGLPLTYKCVGARPWNRTTMTALRKRRNPIIRVMLKKSFS